MNTSPIIFDIETGPLPVAEIANMMPEFEAPANYKDPEKIAAKIEEQRLKWIADSALHANRGQVLAIGYRIDGDFNYIAGQEITILTGFWNLITNNDAITQKVIGFCSNRFDLPFLIRRSWKLGVQVPSTVFHGRYLNPLFVDLYELWQCGDRQASIKLDTLAKFFGLPGKNGDGAHFYEMWEEDREAAIAYLENDLFLTEQCARYMGVIN